MRRQRIDAEAVERAMAAVRSGAETVRSAAAKFQVNRSSLSARLNGKVAVVSKTGPATVLSTDEELAIVDLLLYAGRHYLGITRPQLQENVRKLCNDGRALPWKPDIGPGKRWMKGFFQRHPVLALRSSRIYEANRITSDERPRLKAYFDVLETYMEEKSPAASHIWNTDETGETAVRVMSTTRVRYSLSFC